MRQNHSYTKKEDQIILNEVKKCPENLSKAFAIASTKIQDKNITEGRIAGHYYMSLRHKYVKNPLFMIFSNRKGIKNTKNMMRGKVSRSLLKVDTNPSKFQKIMRIIFE